MNSLTELFLYYKEWRRNRFLTKDLFWFKKHAGLKWVRGQNFGDYLSCIIVSETARKLGLKKMSLSEGQKLLAIGSILHFAQDGDIAWGTGVNGKIQAERHPFSSLDVRMVRGPKTRDFLKEKSISVGQTFGDPALLLPTLFPEYKWRPEIGKITVIPNLNELDLCKTKVPANFRLVSPLTHWRKLVLDILSSELVLTSSLHGIIISETFGVPVRFVMPSGGESIFKYQDYYLGTGRYLDVQPSTFNETITSRIGVTMPKPTFNSELLLNAFPQDVFA